MVQTLELPHATESERAVLGAALLVEKHLDQVLDACTEDDFYDSSLRTLYDCIREERSAGGGRRVEGVSVLPRLTSREGMDVTLAHDLIQECQRAASGAVHLNEHLRILREHRVRRGIIEIAGEAEGRARLDADDPGELLADVQNNLLHLGEKGQQNNLHMMKDVLNRTYDQVKKLSERKGKTTHIPSGISQLDKQTGGFAPEQLIILAARPGRGKTAMALNFAAAAVREDYPVLFCSMEMSPESLMMRFLAAQGHIDASSLRFGNLNNDGFSQLSSTIHRVEDWPLFFDDTPALSLPKLRSVVRRLHTTHGLRMVIIDYLQLMAADRSIQSREQQVADLSRGLKQLSRDVEIPVICLSQLNRGVENRSGAKKVPQLSDLRESGAIEQDADVVCFIHRDDDVEDPNMPLDAKLILAKQRNGPTGTIPLRWLPSHLTFTMPAEDDY